MYFFILQVHPSYCIVCQKHTAAPSAATAQTHSGSGIHKHSLYIIHDHSTDTHHLPGLRKSRDHPLVLNRTGHPRVLLWSDQSISLVHLSKKSFSPSASLLLMTGLLHWWRYTKAWENLCSLNFSLNDIKTSFECCVWRESKQVSWYKASFLTRNQTQTQIIQLNLSWISGHVSNNIFYFIYCDLHLGQKH